jgi:moderate conductance mechanosensitive channel
MRPSIHALVSSTVTDEYCMLLETVAKSLRLASIFVALLLGLSNSALGNTATALEQPPDVQEFLRLLGKADVQEWLRKQQPQVAGAPDPSPVITEASFGRAFSARLTAIRDHLVDLSRIGPRLGAEIRQATKRLREAGGGSGLLSIFLTSLVFAGFGFAASAIVKKWTKPDRRPINIEGLSFASSRRQRLGASILQELIGVLAFCVACFAPLLLLHLDSLSESVLLTFLASYAAWVLSIAVASLFPKPVDDDPSRDCRAERDRICFWIVTAAGWFSVGSAIAEATRLTGMDPLATDLVSYVLGVGLLGIGLAVIWRRPRTHASAPEYSGRRHSFYRWLATLLLMALWTVWVADAMRLFWLLAVGTMTLIALKAARKLTRHLFVTERDDKAGAVPSTSIVVVDSLQRAVVIGIALWVLAGAWGINFSHLTGHDDPISRVARALLTVLAILFVFDVLWQFTKAAIDLKIVRVDETAAPGSAVDVRQARLRTLLPVLRNFAMVVFVTLAVLMTLSTLGVEIGPLIASAGVVGLAIGFGAQTLVKDVISGIFYLLDDAFRVGEYIVSGSYMGTVESFSLRSVRLRHHNGPVFTIPFSVLGAVQNVSRDYSVDKLLITVSYDTDLEKARKLIRRIGEQLLEDPELAPMIIEPLKMQAVNDFGSYGIQLKLKTTTKPGAQSAVRKKAFPLIKKTFDENGIEFAHPMVKVAEGQAAAQVAAGQQVLAGSATPPVSTPT